MDPCSLARAGCCSLLCHKLCCDKEHNTQMVTVGNNLLFTYRLNAGTVVFLGYDDRYQRGTRIDNVLFSMTDLQRTNRAIFTKVSYLFRL